MNAVGRIWSRYGPKETGPGPRLRLYGSELKSAATYPIMRNVWRYRRLDRPLIFRCRDVDSCLRVKALVCAPAR
jgi:hypothetical protein